MTSDPLAELDVELSCTSRLLTADGRVLGCNGHWQGADHWHDPAMDGGPSGRPVRAWDDEDPAAWDATCPDCDGTGHPLPCNATTPRGSCLACPQCVDEPADCPTCGGTGDAPAVVEARHGDQQAQAGWGAVTDAPLSDGGTT